MKDSFLLKDQGWDPANRLFQLQPPTLFTMIPNLPPARVPRKSPGPSPGCASCAPLWRVSSPSGRCPVLPPEQPLVPFQTRLRPRAGAPAASPWLSALPEVCASRLEAEALPDPRPAHQALDELFRDLTLHFRGVGAVRPAVSRLTPCTLTVDLPKHESESGND